MRTATRDIYGNSGEMTYGTQILLIASVAAYFIEHLLGFPLSNLFALRADWLSRLAVWELVSYQFVHQGIGHLLSNMLGLYFLGPDTERSLGTNRFLALYFLSGILGGIGWSLLSPGYLRCVGASGAVFGILGAYAALYPRRELILILFPFMPIKAWVFVLLLGGYELMHVLQGPGSHIANAAHLGGGIAGFLYAAILSHPDLLETIRHRLRPPKRPVSRAEIDRILDKASRNGIHSLSRSEREQLRRASK